jgi:trimeric autotransporter adhesin
MVMETIKKSIAIIFFVASILFFQNKANGQIYSLGSVGSPVHDLFQSYNGKFAFMQGTGTYGSTAALSSMGINTEYPTAGCMLDVYGGDITVRPDATQGYAIGTARILADYGLEENIFLGYKAGSSSVTGQYNTVSGYYAGNSLLSGTSNTLTGAFAGTNIKGSNGGFYGLWNTVTGYKCGYYNQSGFGDDLYGKAAAYNDTSGYRNCIYGNHAAYGTGYYSADSNCFFGYYSVLNISGNHTAENNVIMGFYAGNATGATMPSWHNVFLGGNSAPLNPGGNDNIVIGYEADAYTVPTGGGQGSITNAVAIGADAVVNYNNEFILGNNAQDVGIGMVGEGFPLGKLEVFQHSGTTNTIGEFIKNTDLSSSTTYGSPAELIGLESFIPQPTSKHYYSVAGWFEADPYATTTKSPVVQQYAIFVPGRWQLKDTLVNYPLSMSQGTVDIGFPFNMDFPDYTLDVDGKARFLSIVMASDSTIKRYQTAFKYGIKAVRNLNPITYKYNGEGGFDTNGTYIGLTAQNLKRNVPGGVIYSLIQRDTLSPSDTATIGNVYEEAVLYTAINAIKEVDSAATSNLGKQAQTNDSLRNGLYTHAWGTTGNSGTSPGTNFIGTTDAAALEFQVDGAKSGWIDYTTPGNVALGYEAENSTTGQSNTATGYQSLYTNTSGNYNTAYGYQTLYSNSSGSYNVAVGRQALNSCTGSDNTAVGNLALQANTSGTDNTAIGYQILYSNTTGTFNTGVGDNTLYTNSTGSYNTGLGVSALYYNTGSNNTAVGKSSLLNTTGGNNVAVGKGSGGTNSTGTNNTFIGYDADESTGIAPTNSTALGNGTNITGSNQVNIGNSSVSTIQGEVNYSTYSDRRIKTNIQNNVPGLVFINKLQPVTYNLNIHEQNNILGVTDSTDLNDTGYWNHKYDIERIVFSGLIAQQVDTAALQCGYNFSGVKLPTTPNGLYGLGYADLVVPLIKSVQQLSSSKDSLKSTLDSVRYSLDSLRSAFKNIQSCLSSLCSQSHAPIHHTGGNGNSGDSNTAITNTQDVTLSALSATPILYQNDPNPYTTSTKINYYLPSNVQGASIVFYDTYGNQLKTIQLSQTGNGTINITPDNLTSGIYSYSLVINNNVIDTKRMLLQK